MQSLASNEDSLVRNRKGNILAKTKTMKPIIGKGNTSTDSKIAEPINDKNNTLARGHYHRAYE